MNLFCTCESKEYSQQKLVSSSREERVFLRLSKITQAKYRQRIVFFFCRIPSDYSTPCKPTLLLFDRGHRTVEITATEFLVFLLRSRRNRLLLMDSIVQLLLNGSIGNSHGYLEDHYLITWYVWSKKGRGFTQYSLTCGWILKKKLILDAISFAAFSHMSRKTPS